MGDFGDRRSRGVDGTGTSTSAVQRSPGKRSMVEARYGVQRRRDGQPAPQDEQVHAAAEQGLAQPASALPHADRIQAAFGHHDVSGIAAHVGGAATAASEAMGAEAYATGHHVAFRAAPDLHTAAHEAAHVVQQRAGVALKGGVGEAGDPYEQHADAVADAVVAGRSAESLLDQAAPGAAAPGPIGSVQRKNLEQAGLPSGLKAGNKAAIVSRKNQGNIYTETVADKAGDRTEALTSAASHNAQVGTAAFVAAGKDKLGSVNWTADDAEKLDKKDEATLDPFSYDVTVSFNESDKLTLRYQHANEWTGYVTAIEDSSNKATSGGVNMVVGEATTDKQYSNKHDQDKTGSTDLDEATEGDKEHNLDAYTKIAGEGARWQCVRNHAGNLQNESRFFTADDNDNVVGVTFSQLWLNWVASFGPRYDIPDADVAKAIKGEIKGKVTKKYKTPSSPLVALRTQVAKTKLTTADYNLDTGQSHVVVQSKSNESQTTGKTNQSPGDTNQSK